jgi:membrane-bound inhibitor of C-type lysozyme
VIHDIYFRPELLCNLRGGYRCADSSQFIVGFFDYDSRAHLQIDRRVVTLAGRFGLSGSRYSGGGVTLKISKAGTTVKHAKRPTTVCELT